MRYDRPMYCGPKKKCIHGTKEGAAEGQCWALGVSFKETQASCRLLIYVHVRALLPSTYHHPCQAITPT